MKIVVWNANGIKRKEEELAIMLREEMPTATIITETWLRPVQMLNCPWQVMRVDEHTIPGRPSGGVAVILQPDQNGKFVRRYIEEEYNAIWVRLPNEFDIIAVYVRPNTPPGKIETFLEDVRARARYPFILAGDLNARHKSWCTKNNPRGRPFHSWALKHRISIHAPATPTFVSSRGTSTIDIFVANGVIIGELKVTDGVWNAASDHLAVAATVEHMSGGRELPGSFATRTLLCPKNAVRAATHYRREMPLFEAMSHRVDTACDIDNAYANFLEEVLRPWIVIRGTRSPKYKWFWDDKLQRMAKDRDKLYKKAVRKNNKVTLEEHRYIDLAIKRSAYRKKRGARRREIESMMHMSVPRTQA